jgi:hypothetical protein
MADGPSSGDRELRRGEHLGSWFLTLEDREQLLDRQTDGLAQDHGLARLDRLDGRDEGEPVAASELSRSYAARMTAPSAPALNAEVRSSTSVRFGTPGACRPSSAPICSP